MRFYRLVGLGLLLGTNACASLLGIEDGIPDDAAGAAGKGGSNDRGGEGGAAGTSANAGTGGAAAGTSGGGASGSNAAGSGGKGAAPNGGAGGSTTAGNGGKAGTDGAGNGGTGGTDGAGNGGTGGTDAAGNGGTGGTDSAGNGGTGGTDSAGNGGTGGTDSAGNGGTGGTDGAGNGGTGGTASAGNGGTGGVAAGNGGTGGVAAGNGGTGGAAAGNGGTAGSGGAAPQCVDAVHCANGTCDQPCVAGALQKLVHVAAGKDFTCALDEAGRAWCWGNPSTGLLFQSGAATSGPVRVPYPNGFEALGRGPSAEHMCGIAKVALPSSCPGLGTPSLFLPKVGMLCWGGRQGKDSDGFGWQRICAGEPANGPAVADFSDAYVTPSDNPIPRAPLPAMGLRASGYVNSLGVHQASWNFGGVEALAMATTSEAGVRTRCIARDVLASPPGLQCMGSNTHGIFADGTKTGTADKTFKAGNGVPLTSAPSGATSPRLTMSATHACFSYELDGPLVCWGDNAQSRLDDAAVPEHLSPTTVQPAARLAAVSGSGYCWISGSGATTKMGCRAFPVLGASAVDETVATGARDLSAGNEHVCVATNDGRVLCRGKNDVGQSAPQGGTADVAVLTAVRFPATF
jgi:hypothetical protein